MARPKPTTMPQVQDGPVLVDPTHTPPNPQPPNPPHLATRYPTAPTPRGARRYIARRLAEALPAIASTLVEKAVAGGLPELKVLVQMAGLDEKLPIADPAQRTFNGRHFEDILIEQWRKEQALDATDDNPPLPD